MSLSIDLSGKSALVTGAASGIGRAVAEDLAAHGAYVLLADLNETEGQPVASRLPNALFQHADISSRDDCQALVARAAEAWGGLDILVNNAGITKDNLLFRIADADWDAVLDTNLKSAFVLTRLAARGMIKRRWGRVVNISSVVGISGNKGQANYAASKAGLIGFTKSVARELASRNVLVNAVAPGYIDTEMTQAISADAKTALQAAIPLGRLGTGDDVARAVLFLASDLASYITGQVLVVDGGMVM